MTAPSSPPRTAQSNIETVVQLEEEEERHRSFADRFPEMIGSFAGSVAFVVCQLAFVGLWAVANSEIIPGLPAFDPFPYSLLSGVLGLESVLLTAFKWLYVTAFVQPISGEVFWSVSNGVSKPFFAALLALFAREAGAGRDRIIVLGLDSAGWHTAPNLVVPDGIRLAYLPPYSPELQPAEHLWPILD